MSALRYMMRASASRCHSPPDKSWPPSNSRPTFESRPLRHLLHQPFAARAAQRLHHALVVWRTVRPAHHHVVADRQLVVRVVLEQHADPAAQILRIDVLEIDAADPHGAADRIVEAKQQLDQRALPGAVFTDERDQLAAANVEVQPRRPPARVPPG